MHFILKQFVLYFICIHLLAFDLSAQFEPAFQMEHPGRLISIDSIYKRITSQKDSCTISNYLLNLKNLVIQHQDLQSKILYEIYQLRQMQCRDNISWKKKFDLIGRIVQEARDNEFTNLYIYALTELGDISKFYRRTGAALGYYMKAYEILKTTDTSYQLKPAKSLEYLLGCFFYRLGEFNKAQEFLEKCQSLNKVTHFEMLTHDMLSQIHLKAGDYSCSEYYIDEARKIYLVNDTSNWWYRGWNGIFEGSLAKIHYYKQEYKEAIPLFENAIEITRYAKLFDNVGSFALLLADCYIKENETPKALALLPLIEKAIFKAGDELNFRDYFRLLLTIQPNASPAIVKKNLDSLDYWSNKLKARLDKNSMINQEMEVELNHWKKKQKDLQVHVTRQLYYRNMLWIALAVLVILACLLIYRKQIQLSLQKNKTEEIQERSSRSEANYIAELESFKNVLIEKNRQIELLEIKNSSYTSAVDLENLRANTILTEDDWINFRQLFERAYPDYLSRLSNKFPDLTSGEIRFIVLIKLSLNNKEMASTLGVGTGAIRTMKSRLLKKLDFEEDKSLEQLIDMI